jgi:fructose-bisphosphate aldolase, class II
MIFKKYLEKAAKEKWAIGQFNISTTEALKGVFVAAAKLKSPIIIGTSEGESQFAGLKETAWLVEFFSEKFKIPAVLNLDHGHSLDYIKEAVKAGYKAIHFDGSKMPLKKNIEITRKVVEYCQPRKVIVEGEVGFIGGSSSVLEKIPKFNEKDLTDPEEAREFIEKTKVDGLAVNVGTLHGLAIKEGNPRVNLKRLTEIREKTKGKVFLVLHGGSGTPEKDIKQALGIGIAKININTELRIAYTNSLRSALKENPKEVVPYKYLPQTVKAVQEVVEKKIKLFKSYNKI